MTLAFYQCGDGAATKQRSEYLCEIQYMQLLVHHLMKSSRNNYSVSGFVNISIHRVHVAGLCNSSTAAERLFLRPLFPYLNGVLGTVSCFGSDFLFHVRNHHDSTSNLAYFTTRNTADTVMLNILQATASYRSHPPRSIIRWDVEPALLIWQEMLTPMIRFTIDRIWSPKKHDATKSQIWQVLSRQLWSEITQQLIYTNPLRPGFHDSSDRLKLLYMRRQVCFFSGLGYLNLSYLPSSQSFGQDLALQDILAQSHDEQTGKRHTPNDLADRAAARLLSIPDMMELIVTGDLGSEAVKECIPTQICYYLAQGEVCLRRSNNFDRTQNYLNSIFRYLSPDASQSKIWVRERMLEVKARVEVFYEEVADERLKSDERLKRGRRKGVWWRRVICKGTVEDLLEKKFGKGSAGTFGEAIFDDARKWTDHSSIDRKLQLFVEEIRVESKCCRGSHP